MKYTLTPAQRLILDDVAFDADVVTHSYSGRFMYGATCFGVSGSIDDYTQFVYRLTLEEPELAQLLTSRGVDTDDLGRSTIFYWPTILTDKDSDELAD